MAEAPSLMTVYKSVYVGNIPVHLDEDDLLSFFIQFTDFVHSAKIIRNFHQSRVSRGFGFIVVSEDDAKKLINRSASENPIVIGGNTLHIKRAREERPFQLKKFIPTPGYNCYKRSPLPEFVSYEENEPGKPTIHILNDDVLLAIFKHLQFNELFGIERVCRRWQFLLYEHYRGMSWCFISDIMNDSDASYFEKDLVPSFPTPDPRCDFTLLCNLKEIQNLVSRKQAIDKILQVVGENLPNLSLSQFRGSYFDSRALAQLVPNVQTLCLTCTADLVNLSPITETCNKLTNLFLHNMYINNDVMVAITKINNLETLSGTIMSVSLLGNLPKTIKNLQLQLVQNAVDNVVLNIQHLEKLERLSFYREKHTSIAVFLHQYPTMVNFTATQMKRLAENHKNLKYLRCGTVEEEVDYSVLTSLEHLHLVGTCPLSLFNNLPPKLEVLCIYPTLKPGINALHSVDLATKLPTSLHSFFVLYNYLDQKSLLTLNNVPSVTRLVVFLHEFHYGDDFDLESLVAIPNLKELLFNHDGLQDALELNFNSIADSRKKAVAKSKNPNQEKNSLILYGEFESDYIPHSDHIECVSIDKPMLDGLVFPLEVMADCGSEASGYADMMMDHLFIGDFDDEDFDDDPEFAFHFHHQYHGFDDFYDDESDNGGEGLVDDDDDYFVPF